MTQEFTPISKDDTENGHVVIMTLNEYMDQMLLGVINFYDGTGYWCPDINRRSGYLADKAPPEWATHVAWYSK